MLVEEASVATIVTFFQDIFTFMHHNEVMKIYLARHGRTNYNDLDLCNSDPSVNVHITPEGIEQSKSLASKLKDVSIDRIFVSELKRTRQTAEIVNQFHHKTIETEALLNDHHSGFEGKPAHQLNDALDDAQNKWTVRFNGGESIEDMKNRVAAFLKKIRAEPCEAVLVVTSGWVIRVAVAIFQNISLEEAWTVDAEQGDYLEFTV